MVRANIKITTKVKDEKLRKAISEAIEATAFEMKLEAARKAPVDTGRLKNSINLRRIGTMSWQLRAGTEYAASVEFGTMGAAPFKKRVPLQALASWTARHSKGSKPSEKKGASARSTTKAGGTARNIGRNTKASLGKAGKKQFSSFTWALSTHIQRFGTRAQPFMRPAIALGKRKFKANLSYFIKKNR